LRRVCVVPLFIECHRFATPLDHHLYHPLDLDVTEALGIAMPGAATSQPLSSANIKRVVETVRISRASSTV
jgi:hypothetical protein